MNTLELATYSNLDGLSDAMASLTGVNAPCRALGNALADCTQKCSDLVNSLSSGPSPTPGAPSSYSCDSTSSPSTLLPRTMNNSTVPPTYNDCASAYTNYQKLKSSQGDSSLTAQCNTVQTGIEQNDKLLTKIGSSSGTKDAGSTTPDSSNTGSQ